MNLPIPKMEHFKDVIMCGFLVKSPPSAEMKKKNNGFFEKLNCAGGRNRLFKNRWRERYCVLYKVRYRDKTEIFFEYYKDSQCSQLKGRVDLEHCDCIVDDDRVGKKTNVFSIHTMHNGQKRLYHFSAPNPEIMSQWVRHLVNVTGFVDVSQPLEHVSTLGHLSHLSQSTLGTRRGIPSLRQPIAVQPNSSSSILATSKDRPSQLTSSSVTETHHHWIEDGYGDIGSPGADYSATGPLPEQDDYNKLPGTAHSYVNLSTAPENKEFTANGHQHAPSCPHLPVVSDQMPPALPRLVPNAPPLPAKPPRIESVPHQEVDPSPRPQRPDDDLYFNVWEANDKKRAPAQRPSQANSLPHNGSNARVFRRSQIIGDTSQCCLDYTNIPSNTPVRKMAPAPPPRTVFTSPVKPALPALPPQNFPTRPALDRVPSTSSDCPLPVRDPADRLADSTMDSDTSSGSVCSEQQSPLDEQSAPGISSVPCLEEASSSNPTPGAQPFALSDTASKPRAQANHHHPIPPKQLNYIEPHNLEIGATSNCARSGEDSIPPAPPPKNLFSRLPVPHSPITEEPNSSDDYKTEYREIDPIGTNALAIVTKRYLDDDDEDDADAANGDLARVPA